MQRFLISRRTVANFQQQTVHDFRRVQSFLDQTGKMARHLTFPWLPGYRCSSCCFKTQTQDDLSGAKVLRNDESPNETFDEPKIKEYIELKRTRSNDSLIKNEKVDSNVRIDDWKKYKDPNELERSILSMSSDSSLSSIAISDIKSTDASFPVVSKVDKGNKNNAKEQPERDWESSSLSEAFLKCRIKNKSQRTWSSSASEVRNVVFPKRGIKQIKANSRNGAQNGTSQSTNALSLGSNIQ